MSNAPKEIGKPLRIGIAGAGAFAAFLAESLAPLAVCRLAAIAGRTPAKREAVRQAWQSRRPAELAAADPDPRFFVDAMDLAIAPDIDALLVVTPPHLHTTVAEAAITSGKNVLLEKPGALRAADLERLAALARGRGIALLVNLVMPHSPLVQAVQALLAAEALGPADAATMHNQVHRVKDGHWFWDAEQSGGILIEHGVHFFEVSRRWFGEPVSWQAGGAWDVLGRASIPPRVWATVVHEAGSTRLPVHHYHGFVRSHETPEDTGWQILCRYGRIRVEGWVPERLEVEGAVPASMAEAVDRLLEAIPVHPAIDALSRFRDLAEALAEAGAASDQPEPALGAAEARVPVRRVVALRDRQGWYTALIQARFLDLAATIHHPSHRPLVTVDDAIRDLRLAESCTHQMK
ncbi:Gfo/Idh/MocA family oxidoreductase [Alicyclobacillus sp.]|uniref:Gfo/Idh/MocA family protein n=1 Tax=Alicyclobacillus sp. TaxID=61169 RepID=UPI0025B87E35|nr:Gfo/Idh/MocA family oxidoreductase [Alicyclobacillus sp.]MCL6516117.1 Gfo/Idh/MocA family oxidoreductase [Alicyclobacillus sp.]